MNSAATSWRCFHCDELFTDPEQARLHFGRKMDATPACQIDAAALRKLENQLALYRDEDTELYRRIRHLENEHQNALRRAEEAGYLKGLRDGREQESGL